MTAEEEKVSLVVQRDNLATAELGLRREKGAENSANGVT
jgi:hypothetical protein